MNACRIRYAAVRDQSLSLLINALWLEQEAVARGVRVSPAEVQSSFDRQRAANFPRAAAYGAFLRRSGQTKGDLLRRVRAQLLSERIRAGVVSGVPAARRASVLAAFAKDFQQRHRAQTICRRGYASGSCSPGAAKQAP